MLKVAADSAIKPIGDLFQKLFGGAFEEIGGIMQDSFKVRRFKRQLRLLNRVEEIIREAGYEPQRLADKVAVPLLNAAAVEDDEAMQEKWANLLANAANPNRSPQVSAQFPNILARLSVAEVKILDFWHDLTMNKIESESARNSSVWISAHSRLSSPEATKELVSKLFPPDSTNIADPESSLAFSHLVAEGLVQHYEINHPAISWLYTMRVTVDELKQIFIAQSQLSVLGAELVLACRRPPKAPERP